MVTARLLIDGLYRALDSRWPEWEGHGLRSVTCVGDAWAPATIAAAGWAGRRYAEEFDLPHDGGGAFRREYTALLPEPSQAGTIAARTPPALQPDRTGRAVERICGRPVLGLAALSELASHRG